MAKNDSLQLGPLSASACGDIGFSMICAVEYKRSLGLLQQALNLNPYYPWWFYMGFSLFIIKTRSTIKPYSRLRKCTLRKMYLLNLC